MKNIEERNMLNLLTKREKQIIKFIAYGNTNKEIGKILKISHRTVDSHRTNAMKKLKLNNISGIVRFVYKVGLVSMNN